MTRQNHPCSPSQPWLPPTTPQEAEEALFFFLQALLANRYQATQPLLLTEPTFHTLLQQPHTSLLQVLHHHIDTLLVELNPNTANTAPLAISPHAITMAAIAHNCLLPYLADPVIACTQALLTTVPPARTLTDALVYHAILLKPAAALADWPAYAARTHLLQSLINRSPLTALYHLHLHTPPPLTQLAADLMLWWRRKAIDPAPWHDLADWLTAITPLLQTPYLATHLRQRWLTLPETHRACRNLGLLLEALRTTPHFRDLILSFYEAYQYTTAIITHNHGSTCHWPLLTKINPLLRANGTEKIARTLNHHGNEYFLKFWPLIQLIIAEDGLTHDYNHLTQDCCVTALRPFLDFVTIGHQRPNPDTGHITFISEDTP